MSRAIKKLTEDRTENRDDEESRLRDTNGYMYVTFLQTILAFLMQDAAEALTQVVGYIEVDFGDVPKYE